MKKTTPFTRQALLYVIAAAAMSLDQYTKHLARTNIPLGAVVEVHPALRNVFDLTHTTNTGAAFGIFQNGGMVFTTAAIVVVGAIMFYNRGLPADQNWIRVALGLQMGGAIGNLIDRFRFGPVTDFLHVHYWPVFNVADSCISLGVVILVLVMIAEMRQAKRLAVNR